MENKEIKKFDIDLNELDDYVISTTLIKISRRELEKCEKEEKVPSKEVLDTINTLCTFKNTFLNS